MPHIDFKNDFPGIRGPMAFRPETAKPLSELAEILLRSDNSLSRGERELIAAFVSNLNDCFYCEQVHGKLAAIYLECDAGFIGEVIDDFISSGTSDKMKALLWIASSVQKGGKYVTENQVETARNVGATDMEIHDTVLIASAFCMLNRYIDGLATSTPYEQEYYSNRALRTAEDGYVEYGAGMQ